jgi:hypothetical protein
MYKKYNNQYLRRPEMDNGGRWSSLSDISGASKTTPGELRQHHSLVDIRERSAIPLEDLLDHGSPASQGSADTALLDEDSDS